MVILFGWLFLPAMSLFVMVCADDKLGHFLCITFSEVGFLTKSNTLVVVEPTKNTSQLTRVIVFLIHIYISTNFTFVRNYD
jgi:hypothetical protein